MRAGKCLRALLQRGAGDGPGVDWIGLAARALALTGCPHHPWRDPDDVLADGDQEALEGARDVPTVLDRPNPLLIQLAAPVQELDKAGPARRRGQLAGELTEIGRASCRERA